MYHSVRIRPKEGQLCLCRCPEWNEEGYQVAVYEDGEFGYNSQPNRLFHKYVIGWMALDEEGEPIKTEYV
jgi:hypothetical protein